VRRVETSCDKAQQAPLFNFHSSLCHPSRSFTTHRQQFGPVNHTRLLQRYAACSFLLLGSTRAAACSSQLNIFSAVDFYYHTLLPTVHFAPVIWHPLRPPSTKSNTSTIWSLQRKTSTSSTTSMTTSPSVLPKSSDHSNPSLHPRAHTNPPSRR